MERLNFEQGPIRPPSEAKSLLLRVTRNCPWNKCLFCGVYKGETFSRRKVEEVKEDIRTVRKIMEEVKAYSWRIGCSGRVDDEVVARLVHRRDLSDAFRNVVAWMFYGDYTVFLQDANNLILPTEELVEILKFLKQEIPEVTRVTSYARAKTVSRKSFEELAAIRQAGLDRIHIGLESGSDEVLALMKKGVTAAEHIDAGVKAKAAGMTVSEYWMPGLGGRALSRENALETAKVFNAMNPDFIRLRSLRIPEIIPLHQLVVEGTFQPLSDDEMVQEIRLMIENLEGITSTITSDHMMNLLEDINGTLPQDKEKMLAGLDAYLALPEEDRLVYRLGRRAGLYRSVKDLEDMILRRKVEKALAEVRSRYAGPEGVENFIRQLGEQYL